MLYLLNDSLQQDDTCHESKTTIEKVDNCPQNIEILNRRSIKKNCSRHQTCTGDRLVYHCVMNGGGLVEVCAPRSLITGTYKSINVHVTIKIMFDKLKLQSVFLKQ